MMLRTAFAQPEHVMFQRTRDRFTVERRSERRISEQISLIAAARKALRLTKFTEAMVARIHALRNISVALSNGTWALLVHALIRVQLVFPLTRALMTLI